MENVIEILKEHCNYCPPDMGAVIQALLSVEDKLDYDMKYSLEYLLQKYVIARAKMEPEGLKSIIDKFPVPTDDSNMEESLKDIATNISNKLSPYINDSQKEELQTFIKCSMDLKEKDEVITQSIPSEPKKATEISGENFRESISFIKEGSNFKDNNWNVRLIQSGHTASGRYFPDTVLKESMTLFEGARCYLNHAPEGEGMGDRPIQTFVGWFDNVTLKESDGLYAQFHVLSNSGVPWLKDQILELSEKGKLDLIGLSLFGTGKSVIKRMDNKLVKYAESISSVRSVDLVDVPGAGGKIESIKLSDSEDIKMELEALKNLTLEELKEARPDLFPEDKKEVIKESKEEVIKTSNEPQMSPIEMRLTLREKNSILNDKIQNSNLPFAMRESLQSEFKDTIFEDKDLDEKIKVYREAAAELAPYGGQFYLPASAKVITEEEKFQVAMDRLFGLEPEGNFDSNIRLSGIQEAYLLCTGDYEFNWGANEIDLNGNRFREALPTAAKVVGGGTITFANVLGTSMNRRLLRSYSRQRMWWEPIVEITTINNLKVQDRNRLKSLGALTERTTGGAEYTELTWAENKETWTPTEYGNLLPIAQRAIVNDDLRSLTSASDEMGRSSGITVNEYVSNLFTQNSGTGPALADTFKVFDSSNRATSNLLAVAFSRTSFKTADDTLRKVEDDSSKRLGLYGEYLLIPVDVRETALQLQGSQAIPDSANNAKNIYAGSFTVIEVPQFTDANNWYLMAGPMQMQALEMGFLGGRRDPQMFIQNNPLMGMAFTHDVINYKIRHRFGGGWTDWRPAVGSVL